ncbi:MAG: signal peptidase I [Spirochaetes bacterium]|nr:signal peptidase I [Spirochaetota bacterium]
MKKRKFEYKFYRERHPVLAKIRKGIKYLMLFFLGYVTVHTFLVQTYRIDSITMMPAFKPGDKLIASPLPIGAPIPFTHIRLPGFSQLRRGDVVVLTPPYAEEESLLGRTIRWMAGFFSFQRTWETRKTTDWVRSKVIKRVVGLPGDTIRVRNLELLVKPKGASDYVSEFSLAYTPYTIQRDFSSTEEFPQELYRMESEEIFLHENEYFVVSDHRSVALDSRVWGAIRWEQIRSKVLFVYWPIPSARNRN